jgi:ribosome-interacting GTPase 1
LRAERLTETPVAGDESWHVETVAKRDANKKALEQVEKATDSEPVKGKELLESDELKRQLWKAEERYRSGLSPKKAKSESRQPFRKQAGREGRKRPTP